MDIYFYKMVTDDGGAPCHHGGVLSLAICKPVIRRTAGTGDWLFGFGGKELGRKLIYVAQISKVLRQGSYYRDPEYRDRPDCIYQWRDFGQYGAQLHWKRGSRFHPGGHWAMRDVGSYPSYTAYEAECLTLTRVLARLTQGHRTHHHPEVREELRSLQIRLWQLFPNRTVLGEPHDEECVECAPEDEDDELSRC